jgi:lysophospholipase L1-like esterase
MKSTLILLFILAWLVTGCNTADKAGAQPPWPEHPRLACIGDGTTLGGGPQDGSWDSYPAQLQRLLGSKWQVKNFGVPGASVLEKGRLPYRQQGAFHKALAYNPDIVIIELGSADIASNSWEYRDYFVSNLKELIEDFKALPSNPNIYLCYPPPSFADDWRNGAPNQRLTQEIIPKIEKVAKEAGIPVIDLFTALQDKPELFPDSLHPNAQGARLIAATIYSSIVRAAFLPAAGK